MILQHEQPRSGFRSFTAVPPRLPLRERPNPSPAPQEIFSSFLGPTKSTLPKENSQVPDAPIDCTELWKAVRMAKLASAPKSSQAPSSKGTEAYSNVLHLLGIDIDSITPPGN